MRGAPHVHSLLWLKDMDQNEAPSFWVKASSEKDTQRSKAKDIKVMADILSATNSSEIFCLDHEKTHANFNNCQKCLKLSDMVNRYQKHSHTVSCAKKGKLMTIRSNEGFGRLDGICKGEEIKNISICRFSFP